MPKPFTTFVTTKFVNREAVIAALEKCARRLTEEIPAAEVRLFGSYAAGTPTPRSDADIAVIVPDDLSVPVSRVKDVAENTFLEAPVPVEVFVLTRSAFAKGRASNWGLAGAVARDGFPLVRGANSG